MFRAIQDDREEAQDIPVIMWFEPIGVLHPGGDRFER